MLSASTLTVLLGAGASAEAGLPMSVGMTEHLVEHIGNSHRPTGRALYATVGAMTAHDTAAGASPYAGIDVERLFSAVQLIGHRHDHEVAPFVHEWNRAIDVNAPSEVTLSDADALIRALLRQPFGGNHGPSSSDVRRALQQVVYGNKSQSSGQVFRDLETEMIRALCQALQLPPGSSNYLSPLLKLRPGPIRIATLNYDLSIEEMARAGAASGDTGVESWRGGLTWRWNDAPADVRLLKLHGSIDWRRPPRVYPSPPLPPDRIEVVPPDQIASGMPVVVFGRRGKLRSEGPFLAMLAEFERFLSGTDDLLVIGYSFRDEHINTAIRHWLNDREQTARLIIVDPSFPDRQRANRERQMDRFFTGLHSLVEPPHVHLNEPPPTSPHTVMRCSCSEALNDLIRLNEATLDLSAGP